MDGLTISWIGALAGLAIAIILILRKLNPVYALFLGAIVGALIGGANLEQTVNVLVSGTQSVMGTVLRVLAAGVLAGVMMESGAAETIAQAIVKKFGGGKAGNIISPNPNTIAAARGFNLDLSNVMLAGVLPAICGLIVTVIVASLLKNKGVKVTDEEAVDHEIDTSKYPSLGKAIVAPVVAVVLLMINPIGSISGIDALANFKVDAMYILPIAGVIGMLAMGQGKKILEYTASGLNKMTATVLILIGAGGIAGLISASDLSAQVVGLIEASGISGTFLAPIAGILMAAATASTSTGVILATGSFGEAILNMGTAPLAAAVMVHTGATVIDSLPQGNYFHVTAGAMKMSIKQRMGLIPYEAIVGGTMAIIATLFYGFFF